ncbi:NADP-dependent phosphogluconate dehydrogenase [Roseivirga misakiensis]|uniref:6-phosphogluconate dehydrogenase, decarboxylating n=1 Tax=Roseivirga misakiensis TaxID=1563681 RepID=A0A1E5T024_9BACT|nr:NADP-dependent phosphogluconate dehydrogenase [Roseivirga misakiensis]OEK04709.1 phosphogluconate dehydrogenase (NADP(+)-dependent, decarboxylating) [Roseivirga misakiensis]
MTDTKFDFGLVGLGVMGRNFILNVADNDFSAIGLDLDKEKVDSLLSEGEGRVVHATQDKIEFINKLASPRKIMLLVPAGKPVDAVINDLKPHLSEGDIIIDGGNSFFTDTNRRFEELAADSIHFFGAGVSGGAKGARKGPSIMPGGDKQAYAFIKPIFEAASAKVNGEPCVAHLGNGSAGNYVKMVHNGIEYGLMQLISEAYLLMKNGMGRSNSEIQRAFATWNNGRLKSFLIEITSEIFNKKDDLADGDLIDAILDKGKQKGTGKWTSQNAMDLGIPIPTIDVAVSMREISALKSQRVAAENLYGKKAINSSELTIEQLEEALFFSFIVTYAQGMQQLVYASEAYNYELNLETIAKIWRGGCIIRAELLEQMRIAFDKNPSLENLLLDESFAEMIKPLLPSASKVITEGMNAQIPLAAMSAGLNYFNAFTSGRLPMNLVQAQRDHFGSHTYERLDRDGIFHTEW